MHAYIYSYILSMQFTCVGEVVGTREVPLSTLLLVELELAPGIVVLTWKCERLSKQDNEFKTNMGPTSSVITQRVARSWNTRASHMVVVCGINHVQSCRLMHTCIHTWMHTNEVSHGACESCVSIHIYIHTYIHTYVHACLHSCIYTYTRSRSWTASGRLKHM